MKKTILFLLLCLIPLVSSGQISKIVEGIELGKSTKSDVINYANRVRSRYTNNASNNTITLTSISHMQRVWDFVIVSFLENQVLKVTFVYNSFLYGTTEKYVTSQYEIVKKDLIAKYRTVKNQKGSYEDYTFNDSKSKVVVWFGRKNNKWNLTLEYSDLELEDKVLMKHLCPNDYHPHSVDLGLPSGTIWTCCNYGAKKPQESGYFYSFGEVQTKQVYDDAHYKYVDGKDLNGDGEFDLDEYRAYRPNWYILANCNIARSQYDVVNLAWKDRWRIPTRKQCEELFNCCTLQNVKLYGVNGILFKSKNNGKIIFFPLAGFKRGSKLLLVGEEAYIWTSEMHDKDKARAWGMYMTNDYHMIPINTPGGKVELFLRSRGKNIRGVR